jgi:hypothetical protein
MTIQDNLSRTIAILFFLLGVGMAIFGLLNMKENINWFYGGIVVLVIGGFAVWYTKR